MKIKKRLYYYVSLLVIVVLAMILLKNIGTRKPKIPGFSRDYAQIIESGELNVVTDYNSIGYFVSGDSIEGFQYEMMRKLERDWGVRINVFLENSLSENWNGLLMHKYDIVSRNIPVNSALRDSFAFTTPITLNKLVLVQRRTEFNDSIPPIRQHLDLAKKTIVVARNSPAILRLQNLSHEIGDTIFIREDETYGEEQLVMMVAGGDIDFTVCDEVVAKQLAEQFSEIDVETDISFTQLESWAVRKDSPVLLDSLNAWLSRYLKSSEFKETYKKYY